jgi:hypothetical protein
MIADEPRTRERTYERRFRSERRVNRGFVGDHAECGGCHVGGGGGGGGVLYDIDAGRSCSAGVPTWLAVAVDADAEADPGPAPDPDPDPDAEADAGGSCESGVDSTVESGSGAVEGPLTGEVLSVEEGSRPVSEVGWSRAHGGGRASEGILPVPLRLLSAMGEGMKGVWVRGKSRQGVMAVNSACFGNRIDQAGIHSPIHPRPPVFQPSITYLSLPDMSAPIPDLLSPPLGDEHAGRCLCPSHRPSLSTARCAAPLALSPL